jgi:hypothetical protein
MLIGGPASVDGGTHAWYRVLHRVGLKQAIDGIEQLDHDP